MSRVVVYMSMSLDGFIAAEGDGPGLGLGIGGGPLHAWMSGMKPGNAADAGILAEMMSTGAVITGRHTIEWAGDWHGDHHDGVPVLVLTRTEPAQQPAGGIVHYTSDLKGAVARAKEAAGDKDILMHGASSVQALDRLGLIDEYVLSLVPVVLGRGRRLFGETLDPNRLRFLRSVDGDGVVHLRYAVDHAAV